MPRTYTRRFKVRTTDCDAAGHVNHAVYARYLQEAAVAASASIGYDGEWYAAHGVNWVIRRTRLDYLLPARYGDELDVTTYVVNFRRVRSQRNTDITRVNDGRTIARAATDWVYIDMTTGAPKRIPDDMPATFMPDGPVTNGLTFDPAPPPDTPPPDAFRTARRVYFYEMDENRHLNNAVYLNYLEQAAIDHGASAGLDMPQLLELGGFFVVGQHDIEYLHPARYGDTLDIATWVSQIRQASVLRHTTMRNQAGELCIRAQTRWVWVSAATKLPAGIPQVLRDALGRNQ
jgi:acyl-CoA thioester hydrolase